MYEKCSVGKTGGALYAQPGGIPDPAEPPHPRRPDGIPEDLRAQEGAGCAALAFASLV